MTSISKTKLITIICMALAIAILISLDDSPSLLPETNQTPESEKAEAFIKGANFTLYSDEGYATKLVSKHAKFYTNSDRIDIDSLEGQLTNQDNEVINLSADSGQLQPSNDKINLLGNVLIKQAEPQHKAWTIKGSNIMIDKKIGLITSSENVTIIKDQSVIQAKGLEAHINEKRIKLLNNVRGIYAFTK